MGAFLFLPLDPVSYDVRMYAYQPFLHRLYNPGRSWKRFTPYLILGLSSLLLLIGWLRKRKVFPLELAIYLFSISLVYALSRLLAFKLYVPNRHLQIPMSIFLISFFCIAIWRVFVRQKPVASGTGSSALKNSWPALIAFTILGLIVWKGTGDGLYGSANFNYSLRKKGGAFVWIEKNTAKDALVAGHPTHIDALQLFGKRRAFATTETAHPFYPKYFKEIKRRLEISLHAHYATTFAEFYRLLQAEGIDYFIFSKKRFYPDALASERYFEPLHGLLRTLASKPYQDYVYKKLLPKVNLELAPYLVYRDDFSAIVDINRLKEYILELDL